MTWWSAIVQTLIFCAVLAPLWRLTAQRLIRLEASYLRVVLVLAMVLLAIRPLLNTAIGEPSEASGATVIVLYLVTMLISSLLGTLVVLVLLELVAPADEMPPLADLPRRVRGAWRRQRRYRNAMRVFVRHGLGRAARSGANDTDPATPIALRRALEDLGVTFIKLGQQLSTRSDLLPPAYLEQLAQLQDSAPRFPLAQVEEQLAAALGPTWRDRFADFTNGPLAGASIAQVHRARLLDGTEVVVKLRRPGIRRQVSADLDIMRRLAHTLERRTAWAKRMGLVELAEGFGAALAEELDFRVEAQNTTIAAANLAPDSAIRIPRIFGDLTSESVLVSEFMAGTPLGRAEVPLHELGTTNRSALADQLFSCVMDQLLNRGVFHVDLHPGNLLLQADGTLAMLDFGSVGRLATHTRTSMGLLLAAIGQGNSIAATDYLLEIVDGAKVNERAFEDELGQLMLRHLGGEATDTAAAFTSLLTMVIRHGLRIPGPVAAAFRAIGTLEGTLRALAPGYDLIGQARAQASAIFAEQLHPSAVKDVLAEEVIQALPALRRIPRRIDRVATQLEHGDLRFGVSVFGDPDDREFVRGLADSLVLALLTAVSGGMAVALFSLDRAPYVAPELSLFTVLGGCFLATTVLLSLRVLVGVLERKR